MRERDRFVGGGLLVFVCFFLGVRKTIFRCVNTIENSWKMRCSFPAKRPVFFVLVFAVSFKQCKTITELGC